MKAEEPGDHEPVVKYGMGAEYQNSLVERHFAVMEERRAIAAFYFAYALRLGPVLRAAFGSIGSIGTVAQEQSLDCTILEPEAAESNDLRSALGLS